MTSLRAGPSDRIWTSGRRTLAVWLGALLVFASAGAGLARGANLFWTENLAGMGRMSVDGTHVHRNLVGHASDGASALAVHRGRIYWLIDNGVSRASINGSGIRRRFVRTKSFGDMTPPGLVVSDSGIYFVDGEQQALAYDTIARANLDGRGLSSNFINDATDWNRNGGPGFVAVSHGFLYWLDVRQIGRARLDGTDVNDAYITHLPTGGSPVGFALVGKSFYWDTRSAIGRVGIDGTGLKPNLVTGLHDSFAFAAFQGHLFWGEREKLTRSNLDGSHRRTLYTAPRFHDIETLAAG